MAENIRIEACLTATAVDYGRLEEISRGLERYIRLVSRSGNPDKAERSPVQVHLTSDRMPEPIVVDVDRGVTISLWDVEGTCGYAGIDERTYLVICSLVGISNWRVLESNPLLREEDLRHPTGERCVFMDSRRVEDFALLLEEPKVCPGCADFYHCLGADSELIALREALGELNGRPDKPKQGDSENAREFENDM